MGPVLGIVCHSTLIRYNAVVSIGAPTWVSYGALIISIVAVLVAFASMWISYLNFKSSGPRLRLELSRVMTQTADPEYLLRFTVVNHGRSEVEIEGFHVIPYGERKSFVEIKSVVGTQLPHRLDGNLREEWYVDALEPARRYCAGLDSREFKPHSSWPTYIRFGAKLASGKMIRSHFRFDARKIIADAHTSHSG